MYLIIDTETTGLPGKLSDEPTVWIYQNRGRFTNFRAIQVAAILTDAEFNELHRWCFLLNTPVVCSVGAMRIHGITDARRAAEGVVVDIVADKLAQILPQVTHLIAHNALFDIELLAHEMYTAGRQEVLDMLHTCEIVCTMGIFGKKKLGVLYKAAFARDFSAHDALADCVALRELLSRARPAIAGNVTITRGSDTAVIQTGKIPLNLPEVLPPLSDEQRAIINAVKSHCNVIVSAVAGSGKTTTALRIAEAVGGVGLILTYNRQLAHESAARAVSAGIAAEIRTYHAFAVKYLAGSCYTDEGIIRALNTRALCGVPEYSFILFDECQDMTPVLYELAIRIIAKHTRPLIIMGDPRQNIYRFRGADPKYMTPELWPDREFAMLPLSVSYRLPVAVAAQVAEWSGVNIIGVRGGPAPILMSGDSIFGPQFIENIKEKWLENPNGMLVILPTIRKLGGGAFQHICRSLVAQKVPIYIPKDDNEIPGEVQLRNKVGFISYHQAKGLERDVVLVCLVKHFIKSWGGWQQYCPNEIYVALTRARSKLYVWSDFNIGDSLNNELKLSLKVSVTDLCRHLLPQILVNFIDHVDIETIKPTDEKLETSKPIHSIYSGREIVEDVSDIIGVMIPGIYSGFDPKILSTEINAYILQTGRQMPKNLHEIADVCKAYLYYYCWINKQLHRVSQINNFEWIDNETLEIAKERMKQNFEQYDSLDKFEVSCQKKYLSVEINGRVDMHGLFNVWELKYTDSLTEIHKLQCAIYSWITSMPGLLFNIRTGELLSIRPRANFDLFMRAVICAKFHGGSIGQDFDAFEFCRGCNDELAAV